eukprot:CAMPEP_0197679248 /NCGR_PEP_ID=MMETSP1338-20131121/91391_1 /TAXON_ID=43686 ORGANISM="Pelagodinium beii, Strain RCC1491" /NCGR_SAMPLE_ID=MMETSP1338 /ASSEMBLY_ACC=CAM_ASM_000754 /LENGTH=100 /DNA_ID=CAMNT_0043260283 /DNA_START=20 /DNA_END=322 /DNA_ORIENTATION=+
MIKVDGLLSNGDVHKYVLQSDWKEDEDLAALVGCRFQDGSWGQTVVGEKLQTCFGKGFKRQLRFLDLTDARDFLDPAFCRKAKSAKTDHLQHCSANPVKV